MEHKANPYQIEQEVAAFLDCIGNMYVFSPHQTPDGKICRPKGNQVKLGVRFIIDRFDERNLSKATAYYGQCGLCKSRLILPKSRLQANG
ncbi:hypothetical protein HZA76_00490 [Candidatus Roizmanbacteria bacterium]|nr:hypothetical protein [Candidatus Roizmanbacteria bacterium]